MSDTGIVILHPPVLPYDCTLHHRFQRVWEVSEYVRRSHPNLKVVDAGMLNMLQGDVLRQIGIDTNLLAIYIEPQMVETVAALLERARQLSPGMRVLLYGPACQMFPDVLRELPVDAIGCRGDFEQQITEAAALGSDAHAATAHIAVRDAHGWRDPTSSRPLLDPAEWAYPPLEVMPIADIERIYAMKRQVPTMAVTVARGCPFSCSFCATPAIEGRRDRRRPIDGLLAFLERWREVKEWQFYAPTFTFDRAWTLELCERLVESRSPFPWRCTTRADRLDDELIEAIASAGCCQVGIGVETIGPARDLLRKPIPEDLTASVVQALVRAGVRVKCYVLMGLPRQNVDEVRRTIDFVRALGAEPRPTLYSPQGDVDQLVGLGLVSMPHPTMVLDRKVFLPDGHEYGDYLRILYQS